MQDFRRLKVWQKAHQLTLCVYRVTASFPREELFGLTSQMRRSCASIPANIAEGCGRDTRAELARFLCIATGSASELHYHLILAKDLGYGSKDEPDRLLAGVTEVKRMLSSLLNKIRAAGTDVAGAEAVDADVLSQAPDCEL